MTSLTLDVTLIYFDENWQYSFFRRKKGCIQSKKAGRHTLQSAPYQIIDWEK
jgi:hypothetical protein